MIKRNWRKGIGERVDDVPVISRRIAMQNDLDLMRRILETVRDREDTWPKHVDIAGYPPIVVARHVERLHADGLLDGTSYAKPSDPVADIVVRDLSTSGHRFLAAMETDDVWSRMKAALSPSELGSLSIGKLAAIAGDLAERAIRKKLGLD